MLRATLRLLEKYLNSESCRGAVFIPATRVRSLVGSPVIIFFFTLVYLIKKFRSLCRTRSILKTCQAAGHVATKNNELQTRHIRIEKYIFRVYSLCIVLSHFASLLNSLSFL